MIEALWQAAQAYMLTGIGVTWWIYLSPRPSEKAWRESLEEVDVYGMNFVAVATFVVGMFAWPWLISDYGSD